MGRIVLFTIMLVIVAVAVAFVYLAFTDLPAPTGRIERVIPDAKLPK